MVRLIDVMKIFMSKKSLLFICLGLCLFPGYVSDKYTLYEQACMRCKCNILYILVCYYVHSYNLAVFFSVFASVKSNDMHLWAHRCFVSRILRVTSLVYYLGCEKSSYYLFAVYAWLDFVKGISAVSYLGVSWQGMLRACIETIRKDAKRSQQQDAGPALMIATPNLNSNIFFVVTIQDCTSY